MQILILETNVLKSRLILACMVYPVPDICVTTKVYARRDTAAKSGMKETLILAIMGVVGGCESSQHEGKQQEQMNWFCQLTTQMSYLTWHVSPFGGVS